MSRVCAAGLALLAFSCALIIGLCAGNPFVTVVGRAIKIMIVFYVLGLVLAVIGEKTVKENFENQAQFLRGNLQPEEAPPADNETPAVSEATEASAAVTPAVPG